MTGASSNLISGATALLSVGGGVTSVFGRTGVVTAQTGDYNISQISGAGTAAAENLSAVIIDNGAGALTIGAGQVTAAMLVPGIGTSTGPANAIQTSDGAGEFLGTANATLDSSGNAIFAGSVSANEFTLPIGGQINNGSSDYMQINSGNITFNTSELDLNADVTTTYNFQINGAIGSNLGGSSSPGNTWQINSSDGSGYLANNNINWDSSGYFVANTASFASTVTINTGAAIPPGSQSFNVLDNNGGVALQVNTNDASNYGDRVRTHVSILDAGDGRMGVGTLVGAGVPAYALDIYDAASTGIDIGNSYTGLWSIDNSGAARFHGGLYVFDSPAYFGTFPNNLLTISGFNDGTSSPVLSTFSGSLALNGDGSAKFAGGNLLIDTFGDITTTSGQIFLLNGAISLGYNNGSAAWINYDGSASFANNVVTIDSSGNANFNSVNTGQYLLEGTSIFESLSSNVLTFLPNATSFTMNGNTGFLTALYFSGDGSNLTNISSAGISGQLFYNNANVLSDSNNNLYYSDGVTYLASGATPQGGIPSFSIFAYQYLNASSSLSNPLATDFGGSYWQMGNMQLTSALDANSQVINNAGNITSSAFITSGGTSSEVVLGDGTLGTYINPSTAAFVNNATNATLTRSGTGPYTLGLNLGNANTWTGQQTFNTSAAIFGVGAITPKIYPASDSTTAVQILKANGTSNILNVDTTNGRIGIGNTAPNEVLEITGNLRFTNGSTATIKLSDSTSGIGDTLIIAGANGFGDASRGGDIDINLSSSSAATTAGIHTGFTGEGGRLVITGGIGASALISGTQNSGGRGSFINITSGAGGQAGAGSSVTNGGPGGDFVLTAGAGGATAANTAGASGTAGTAGGFTLAGAVGGSGVAGPNNGGAGSTFSISAGTGGAPGTGMTAGAGGVLLLTGGNAGIIGSGIGNTGGDIRLTGGVSSGTTSGGNIYIVGGNASSSSNYGNIYLGQAFGGTKRGEIINGVPMRLAGYTVATLPAGNQGDTAFCTDLLTPGFLVIAVGGGAVVGPVFFNGTNWVAY